MSRYRQQISHFFYLIALIPFIFTACDELGLLNGIVGSPVIRLNLDDSLVHPGEEIDILVESADNPPDKLTARLERSDGSFLNLNPVPPLEGWMNIAGVSGELLIPDSVPEGFYTLVSEAWMDEKLLSEERIGLFVLYGDWAINSLELFPPQSVPGGLFYIHAVLELPGSSNPRIRWIQDDVIVAEGLLSEGWDTVVLDAGSSSGVQPLTVELYLDNNEKTIPLRSFSTDLYTSGSIPAGIDNLSPADSYAFLQHFDGKLDGEPDIVGKPRPVNTPKGMGFRFTPGDGFLWEQIPLLTEVPVMNSGEWLPFSLTIDALPLRGSGGRLLELGDENCFFVLSFSSTGELNLNLNDGEYSSEITFPETDKGTAAVTLSFQPDEGGLNLTWLIDGDTVAADRWEPMPLPPGRTIDIALGGDEGFSGIVTELGLRVPGVEPDRFAFYRDTGEDIIVAEGFEDTSLQSSVNTDTEMAVAGGSLVMPPSKSIRFPSGTGELVFEGFSEKESIILTLFSQLTGEVFSEREIAGKIRGDSSDRIIIPLEKEAGITDNEDETFYELRTSGRNGSDLRLEYILVNRE